MTMKCLARIVISTALATSACGSDAPSIVPDTDEFNVDGAAKEALDDAAKNGEGAEGTYTYDEGTMTLTLSIAKSTFGCGPVEGTITATVESVSASTLVLRFDGDGDPTTFDRVDLDGQGLVGIWKTSEPNLYLVLSASGSAQIFGESEACENERPRNSENCLQAQASAAPITIDGDLSDWDGVGASATVSDPAGDHEGEDDGADVLATKVAYASGTIFVLTQLAAAPSTAFQRGAPPNDGFYRLSVQGYNALSVEASVYYNAASEQWEMTSATGGVEAEVGDTGIEWAVDISANLGEGFESVDFIMAEPWAAQGLDPVECVYFDL